MNGQRVEFLVDLLWIVLSGGYCAVALGYPPDGRMVPLTIGLVALAVGLLHFSGNFIPIMRPLTHGRDESGRAPAIERSEVIAGLWALGLLAGIFLVGAVAAVFLFILLYLGLFWRHWILGLISAVAMAVITWGLFGQMIGIPLPEGLITPAIINLF